MLSSFGRGFFAFQSLKGRKKENFWHVEFFLSSIWELALSNQSFGCMLAKADE